MNQKSLVLIISGIIISGSGTLFSNVFADITMNGDVDFGTHQSIYHGNYTKLTINQIQVSGLGLAIVPNLNQYPAQYNFSSPLVGSGTFHMQIQNITSYQTDFRILTTGLTDVNGTVNTAQIKQITVDGTVTSSTWKGQLSTFAVNSGKQIREIFALLVNAFHHDGITTVYGQARQSNLTSSNNIFTLVSGSTYIPGTWNLNNFTIWNSLINFAVGKSYNVNTTSIQPVNKNTNDFDVDCPSTGTGTDIELWTNETDGHRISSFTTPTCFANNTVKWSTTFTANGNSGTVFPTEVWIKIVNATFLNNATLKYNTTMVTTALANPYIVSNHVNVGTGLQTKLFNWSMNLTVSPAFQPVNFTVGHISVTGVNHNTAPIQFSTNKINSTTTAVTVSFPTGYNMAYDLTYNNEGKTQTLTGLPTTSPSLGTTQSVITFKNPSNDTVLIKAYDLLTKNNATYQLTQPNNQIPFVQQIMNFKNGTFGTKGMIGAIDIVTLIVLIIAMIGLNRVNETVGAVIMVMVIGGIAYFGIVSWPVTMTAAIALIFVVIISSTKKLPWS